MAVKFIWHNQCEMQIQKSLLKQKNAKPAIHSVTVPICFSLAVFKTNHTAKIWEQDFQGLGLEHHYNLFVCIQMFIFQCS